MTKKPFDNIVNTVKSIMTSRVVCSNGERAPWLNYQLVFGTRVSFKHLMTITLFSIFIATPSDSLPISFSVAGQKKCPKSKCQGPRVSTINILCS